MWMASNCRIAHSRPSPYSRWSRPVCRRTGRHGRTGHGAVVDEFIGGPVTSGAGVQGFDRFGGSRVDPHDAGDVDGGLRIRSDTQARAGLALDNGDGCGTAARKTAAAAVGAGQEVLHFSDAWIFVNIEDFGGDTEDDAAGCANAQHNNDSDGHEILLETKSII
jgi:hypothetical protein